MTRKRSKGKTAATRAFEAAIAAETEELHKQLEAKERENQALRRRLASIARMAGGVPSGEPLPELPPEAGEAAAGTLDRLGPKIGPDGKEDFGDGLPPDQRPKAVFEEEPETGIPGELSPQDIHSGEPGRWV